MHTTFVYEHSSLKSKDTLLHTLLQSTIAMPNLLVALLIPLLLNSISDSAQANDAELRALLIIKKDWGNPAALTSWKNSSSETAASASSTHCRWAGVACNNDGQGTGLSFQNFNISRPIPASICSLKNLAYMDLSYNNLTGRRVPGGCTLRLLGSAVPRPVQQRLLRRPPG